MCVWKKVHCSRTCARLLLGYSGSAAVCFAFHGHCSASECIECIGSIEKQASGRQGKIKWRGVANSWRVEVIGARLEVFVAAAAAFDMQQ